MIMNDEYNDLINGICGIKISSKGLPIAKYRDRIIETVRNHQIVIIFGDTGSGKTTQIPQYLLQVGINEDKVIGVTQPRRIAAVNMARRVSEEMRCCLGVEVGYEIRFNKKCSGSTKIKFMTDGILLNNCLTDPKLSEFGVIMIDEAHERTVDTDVLLGLLKIIAEKRKDLKILITSATIKTEKFSKYFKGAPIISFEGKMHHVEIVYEPDYYYSLTTIKQLVQRIQSGSEAGDVLVFLTGQDEIEECCGMIENINGVVVLPLYGSMDYDEQQKIFLPVAQGHRKVIVSTNIAETSITIDGIRFVIDFGYVKQNNYNPRTGIETLKKVRISQAQAEQRKGRAGRTDTGWCYRLYSEQAYQGFIEETNPEIYRKNLSGTCLKLAAIGLDPMNFNFIDSPSRETLQKYLEELQDLEFLDKNKQITELGKLMEDFPVEPRIGKALLKSDQSCSLDVITILAMLTEKNIFIRSNYYGAKPDLMKKKFFNDDGDHFMLLKVFNTWLEEKKSEQWCYDNFINYKTMEQVDLVRTQLIGIMKRKNLYLESSYSPNKNILIKKAMISGFYKNICYRRSKGVYINYNSGEVLYMHPGSCLMSSFPHLILYYEVVLTKRPYMHGIITLTDSILQEFPSEMVKIKYQADMVQPIFFMDMLNSQ